MSSLYSAGLASMHASRQPDVSCSLRVPNRSVLFPFVNSLYRSRLTAKWTSFSSPAGGPSFRKENVFPKCLRCR